MSIFKVEFTLWVDDSGPHVCARDYLAAINNILILDWEETEMILEVAPWVGHMCEGCPECEGGSQFGGPEYE